MHCQTCGTHLRSSARFCNHCGKSVIERFGSALLHTQDQAAPETPTENLAPKTRTAPNPKAPSTLEGQPHISTDQLGLRGTGRQPLAKSTAENVTPKLEPRATVVEARAFKEAAPTRPEPTAKPHNATTIVEASPLPMPPPPPPPATLFVPPPILTEPPKQVVEFIAPSTEQLQQDALNKPFFTRMLTLPGTNTQHQYLIYAVPLVLLAALVILFIAFYVLR